MGRLYDRCAWRDHLAPFVLAEEPLCRYCALDGHVTAATVVDHIHPISTHPELALERSNVQPLCKRHHDSTKAQQERRGYHDTLDANGYPIDPAHPANLAPR